MAVNDLGRIGSCRIDKDGNIIRLHRGYSGQGWIYKDQAAFYDRPCAPYYVPELTDNIYTGNGLRELCCGQGEIAGRLFHELDWQNPSALMGEWEADGEIRACRNCRKLVLPYDANTCPYCRAGVDQEE